MGLRFRHTAFWICFCTGLILRQSHATKSSAIRILPPPSREELLAHFKPNASLHPNITTLSSSSSFTPMLHKIGPVQSNTETKISESVNHEDLASSRGIVSSITQQASNIGKGILDFFRGGSNPPHQHRGPIPFPGPPILRPFPMPPGFPSHGPVPHLALGQPEAAVDKDRVGPSNVQGPSDRLEGGFLPSKKLFNSANLAAFATSSTAINSSKVELPTPKAPCDFYTDSLCLESHPYPFDQLRRMGDIELLRLRHMMADVQEQSANVLVDGVSTQEEVLYNYEHYYGNEDNNTHSYRDYGADGGFVCPSDIKYARPRRAKSSRGKWKVIVNFADFTQTIRMEKCLKPYSRCSYVFSYLNSECVQIYNYQRLVSWEPERGFHVDIYKIPTACSCHIRSSSNLKVEHEAPRSAPSAKPTDGQRRIDGLLAVKSSTSPAASFPETVTPPLGHRETNHKSFPVASLNPRKPMSQNGELPKRQFPQMKPSRFQGSQQVQVESIKDPLQTFNNPHLPHRRLPNFRLPEMDFRNGLPQEVAHVDQTINSDTAAAADQPHSVLPNGRVPGRPFIPRTPSTFRHRGLYKNMVGQRPATDNQDKEQSESNVRRVNYNVNPISDFLHPWNG